MAKMKEVKCPDCNSVAEYVKLSPYSYEGFIRCPSCGREGRLYSSKANAEKAWYRTEPVDRCKEIKCTGCGGIAEFVKTADRDKNGKIRGYISCPNCGKTGREYADKYRAVKIWYREVVPEVMTHEELVNRINYECNVRDWSYDKLSWVSGVPFTTLLHVLQGTSKNPSIFLVLKLCKAFGITVDELLGDK